MGGGSGLGLSVFEPYLPTDLCNWVVPLNLFAVQIPPV